MTQFKKQLAGALATGLLVVQMVAPLSVFATDGITLEVSGNGANSDSTINAAISNTNTVVQTNTANVTNTVDAKSTSGGNDANYNTGGDVLIKTGDATSDVEVTNDLNKNVANIDCCGANSTDVLISGNGYKSKNDVNLSQGNANTVVQTNSAKVLNDVYTRANSGYNDGNYNTGGDVTILTGKATAGADVSTQANVNVATIGGGNQGQGDVSLMILGNGANSDNDIKLALANANSIIQTNVANITNDVYAKANSGKNDANYNTGGDVTILTGKADAMVGVDNSVNFNWADIDCGCITDLKAKIAGNGYESDNDINASLAGAQVGVQTNTANLLNDVDAKAKSGYNDADYNTGGVQAGDPAILTGNASSETLVENLSNWNVFGNGLPDPLPEVNFDFDFDWSWFLFMMQLHQN